MTPPGNQALLLVPQADPVDQTLASSLLLSRLPVIQYGPAWEYPLEPNTAGCRSPVAPADLTAQFNRQKNTNNKRIRLHLEYKYHPGQHEERERGSLTESLVHVEQGRSADLVDVSRTPTPELPISLIPQNDRKPNNTQQKYWMRSRF